MSRFFGPRRKSKKTWKNIADPVVLLKRNVYGHHLLGDCGWSSVGTWNGNSTELGMSICSPRRIILVGIWWWQKLLEESRIWLPCGRNWWNMLILTNQLDFLITCICEALNLRACKSNEIVIDQDRGMFESRLLVGATEKLLGWEKPTCSIRWEILRTGEQKDRAVIQSLKSLLRWSHFKKEELESDWELSEVCSQIVLKCWNLPRPGRPDILCSVNQLAVDQFRKMFESRFFGGNNWKNTRVWKASSTNSSVVLRHARTCSEMRCSMLWTSKQESRTTVQSCKSWFEWSSIQAGGTRIRSRIVKSMLTNCLEMLVLGTNWTTWHSEVGQQNMRDLTRFSDSGMRQTISFLHISHKRFPTILSCGKHSSAL